VKPAASWQGSVRQQLSLSAYWFAVNMQSSGIFTILVPAALLRWFPRTPTALLGQLAALGALLSMVVPPVFGAWSDRARRRGLPRWPMVAAGTAGNVVGLGVMSQTDALAWYAGGLMLAVLGQNVAVAAYEAMMPEAVPPDQWGAASGYVGLATLTGSIAGLTLAGLAPGPTALRVMAGTALAAAVITAVEVPADAAPGVSAAAESRPVCDFVLGLVARFLVMMGMSLLMTYVLYFFQAVLHVARPSANTAGVALLALLGAAAATMAAGRRSDRSRRRTLVFAATLPMGLAALAFSLWPSPTAVFGAALLFGVGYGAFLSVDWALSVSTLPRLREAGRDLGVVSLVSNFPAVLAPLLGAGILGRYALPAEGYRALFAAASLCFLLGGAVALGIDRRRAPGAAPWWWMPVDLAVALLLVGYTRLAYRVRVVGRLGRPRPATLILANHGHDLDGMVIPATLYLQGPWDRPVYSVGSQRLFEPGFLGERLGHGVGALLAPLSLARLLRILGVVPVENSPRIRPLGSLAYEILTRYGPLRLREAFHPAALADLGVPPAATDRPLTWLLRPRAFSAARRPCPLSAVREPYRGEIRAATRHRVDAQLDQVARLLEAGQTVYLTPEGAMTRDGRLGRIRYAVDRTWPLARVRHLLGVAYDPFRPGRLRLVARLVTPTSPAFRDPTPPAELATWMAAVRPITFSQLLAAVLVQNPSGLTAEAIARAMAALAAGLPPLAYLDPDLPPLKARTVRRALRFMERRGFAVRLGPRWRAVPGAADPRFSGVADMVRYQANWFEETVAALRAARRGAGERTATTPESG
jgi:MFS family permease